MSLSCPLCLSPTARFAARNQGRQFFRCEICQLIFVDPQQRLSPEAEKLRYEQHNNDVNDPRYREFVSPLYEVICEKMPKGSIGLDFGAGTGPVLSLMLEESGYVVRRYDPFFWPDQNSLKEKYDFIVASEVVEHFSHPRQEFTLLRQLLKPGGVMAVMTLLYLPETKLDEWYYLKDPTHVCGYAQETFHWMKDHYNFAELEISLPRVVTLRV